MIRAVRSALNTSNYVAVVFGVSAIQAAPDAWSTPLEMPRSIVRDTRSSIEEANRDQPLLFHSISPAAHSARNLLHSPNQVVDRKSGKDLLVRGRDVQPDYRRIQEIAVLERKESSSNDERVRIEPC